MKFEAFIARYGPVVGAARALVDTFDEIAALKDNGTRTYRSRKARLEADLEPLLEELILAAARAGREN